MLKMSGAFSLFTRKSLFFLGIMSLCRIVFWAFNINYFSDIRLLDFIQGIRFDLVTMTYGLAPVYLTYIFLFKYLDRKIVQRLVDLYFNIISILYVAVNCIDVIYFKFTLKRSTWDIFKLVSTGDDVINLIPQFLSDFWYMVVIFIAIALLIVLVNKRITYKKQEGTLRKSLIFSGIMIFILVFAARGGFQLKPLNIIDASRYTQGQNVVLVLSTPFSLMKTISSEKLELKAYFPNERDAQIYFDPHIIIENEGSARKKNVVVIIMESFSREYIGFYNNGEGYTNFLDSLMRHSIVFDNAFANGKRSIEALPAIFSSLPNLMNDAYNTSPYSGNRIESLASILGNYGYNSHFYHGGKNGTMGFDSYVKYAGFDNYNGLDQYPDMSDYDESWGIFDVPYFQYVAGEQDNMKEPFLSAVFSLSAHHPYKLPQEYASLCNGGSLPIHPTICYSDEALRKYFKRIQQSSWYKNTVFIITADHTAQSVNKEYKTTQGIYAIPLVIFDPSNITHRLIENTTQQADITPTILDYLDVPVEMIAFGKSALGDKNSGFAINYLSGMYQLIENEHTILFDGNGIVSAYFIDSNSLKSKAIKKRTKAIDEAENRLKSIIQQYNSRMIENELTLNEKL